MIAISRVGPVLLLLAATGCSSIPEGGPEEARAVEVLSLHWGALKQGDWQSAFDGLHPDLRMGGITLKQFSDLQARRLGSSELPREIRVVGSEWIGEDLVVSFDLLTLSPGGGEPVAMSPRRKVRLRKSGDSWGLMTNDVLAVRSF